MTVTRVGTDTDTDASTGTGTGSDANADADGEMPPTGIGGEASASSSPVTPRDPGSVMRLARLGAFHQTRLSFMRQLTRRLQRERWTFTRPGVRDRRERGSGMQC